MRRQATPRLMILSDAAGAGAGSTPETWFREVLEPTLEAAAPGSVAVQLRHKERAGAARLGWARTLRQSTRKHRQWFVVNDRLDIALCVGADGVHLPEDGISVADARRLLGEQAWISRACHEESAERAASATGAPDAWVVSPVWAPRKGRDALGDAGLRRMVATFRSAPAAPAVLALGGVTPDSAGLSFETGAVGVAVVGAAATLAGALELLVALGIRTRG